MFSQNSDMLFISSPMKELPVPSAGSDELTIRVCGPLTNVDAVALSDHAANYGRVTIWIDPRHRQVRSFRFLRHFPFLYAFRLWDFEFKSFSELEHVPRQIRELSLEETRSRTLSLDIVKEFPNLESLWIDGHKKDIASLQRLQALKFLCLRSLTLPDLSEILPLQDSLRELCLILGGTSNLGLLPEFRKLRYLSLTRIRGLTDIAPLGSIVSLQRVHLCMLKQVSEMPDMSRLFNLRRLELHTMNGLVDLKSVASAPSLRELSVSIAQGLEPNDFEPLIGHNSLEYASVGLGSDAKNQAVKEILGLKSKLPKFEYEHDA